MRDRDSGRTHSTTSYQPLSYHPVHQEHFSVDHSFASTETIYAHAKREEWGFCILAYERRDRRGYQFQDGRLRVFKEGYYDMLEPVSPKPEGTPRIISSLKTMLAKSMDARDRALAAKDEQPTVSFDALKKHFLELRPGGFDSDEYKKDVRGSEEAGATRRLKRHRDPAIAEAQERLSKKALKAFKKNGGHEEVRQTLVEVLKHTDLVTKKQLEPLQKLDAGFLSHLTDALIALLYGDSPYEARFERFVQVLEASKLDVTWELATAPSALVHPSEHLYVKRTSMNRFTDRFAPKLNLGTQPAGLGYARVREMAIDLVTALSEADLKPVDFLDIAQLVVDTMKPKVLPRLEELNNGGD